MRSLTYYVGATVDGYIAGPAGEVDHFPVSDDHVAHMIENYPEVLPTHARRALGVDDQPNRRFDTVVMGRGTYQPALEIDITDPYAHLRTYLASSDPTVSRQDPRVTVTSEMRSTVRALKAEEGELGIWLAGGGHLAGELAEEIDELIVKVYPVVTGAGIRAVDGRFARHQFELVDVQRFSSGCVALHHRRR